MSLIDDKLSPEKISVDSDQSHRAEVLCDFETEQVKILSRLSRLIGTMEKH